MDASNLNRLHCSSDVRESCCALLAAIIKAKAAEPETIRQAVEALERFKRNEEFNTETETTCENGP